MSNHVVADLLCTRPSTLALVSEMCLLLSVETRAKSISIEHVPNICEPLFRRWTFPDLPVPPARSIYIYIYRSSPPSVRIDKQIQAIMDARISPYSSVALS